MHKASSTATTSATPTTSTRKAHVGKKATPYPSVRQSDVIWEMVIWREIDFNEKFNQFFYFPKDAEQSTQGRISLVNLIMRGVRNGEIPVYEDDDMVKELELIAEA